MDNFAHCAALVREADRDRYLATLFAPAAHRNALLALYAFNVEISRVRDSAREPMPGEIRLQWWREALSGERAGEAAANPVAAALRETLTRYRVGGDRLIGLIDAHAFDLYDEPMPTVTDLEIYGIKTQSALLAVAAEVLGGEGPAVELLTLDAGVAFAITSVLQNLGRQASRHQLYLPLDLLKRHRADINELFAGQVSDALRAVVADLRALARRHLAAAQDKLASVSSEILPALLPVALTGPTLRKWGKAVDPLRVQPLAPWRRQWLLWHAARNPRRIFQG
jgi:phytoene synthase